MAGLSFEPQSGVSNKEANAAFKKGLNKVYGWYTGGFLTDRWLSTTARQNR